MSFIFLCSLSPFPLPLLTLQASAVALHRPYGEPLGLAAASSRPWNNLPPPPPPAAAPSVGGTPGGAGVGTPAGGRGDGVAGADDASSEGDEARWLSEAALAGPSDVEDSQEDGFVEREETVELAGSQGDEEGGGLWAGGEGDEAEGAVWVQGEEGWEDEDEDDAFARLPRSR